MIGMLPTKGMLDEYNLITELGRGLNAKVYLGIDKGISYAIKCLKNMSSANMKAIMTEIEVLKKLQHENIIRLFSFREGVLVKPSGVTKQNVVYAVIELAECGEIFQFLLSCGRFPEPLARYYYKSLIGGLNYCHQQGYAHRDIKPENLLLNSKFVLKIADFGFATALCGKDGSSKLHSILGTESYMAPEIHQKTAYSGVSVDLFASSIVLFIMVAGHPPFNKADTKDPYYLLICTNRHQKFWELHSRSKPKGFFSPEFISLMNGMLAFDPTQRLSIAEIISHPWYNGPTASYLEVEAHMRTLKTRVDEDLKKEKMDNDSKKKMRQNMQEQTGPGHTGYRSLGVELRSRGILDSVKCNDKLMKDVCISKLGEISKTQKKLEVYKGSLADNYSKHITTILEPEDIVKLIVRHYVIKSKDEDLTEVKISDDEYKVKNLAYTGMLDGAEGLDFERRVTIGFKVSKIDEDTNIVIFVKQSGDSILFYKKIEEYRQLFSTVVSNFTATHTSEQNYSLI